MHLTIRPFFIQHNLQQHHGRLSGGPWYDGIRDPGLSVNQNSTFSDSLHYTLYLSAFIKTSQLLGIQRVVLAVDRSEVRHVADILNVMQECFVDMAPTPL